MARPTAAFDQAVDGDHLALVAVDRPGEQPGPHIAEAGH
jgi:hypothetical protein